MSWRGGYLLVSEAPQTLRRAGREPQRDTRYLAEVRYEAIAWPPRLPGVAA